MRDCKFNKFHAVIAGLVTLAVLCGVAVFKNAVRAEIRLPLMIAPIEFADGIWCTTQDSAETIVKAMPTKHDMLAAAILLKLGMCHESVGGPHKGFVVARGFTGSGWQVEGINLNDPREQADFWIIWKMPDPI